MSGLYDNGEMLLGNVEDILEYAKRQNEADLIDEEDYEEIIETLKDLELHTIVAINYDHGMGMSFDWWTKEDEMDMEVY